MKIDRYFLSSFFFYFEQIPEFQECLKVLLVL